MAEADRSSKMEEALPRPFYDGLAWSRAKREAARALWHWHVSLYRPAVPTGAHHAAFFAEEQERAASGQALRCVPVEVCEAAFRACRAHDLPLGLLGRQVGGAQQMLPPVRFKDQRQRRAVLDRWVVPHGLLLAHLAGAAHSWQEPLVTLLTLGFFYTGRLVNLPRDLAEDRLFLPEHMLHQAGVTIDQLRAGTVDEPVRRLLWKEMVRTRDSLSRGRKLMVELPWWPRLSLKRWWLAALELLNEIEAKGFDVWSQAPSLSPLHRVQVELQTLFGRATSRTR